MNKADDMETLKVFSPYDGEQIGELNPVGEPEMESMMATRMEFIQYFLYQM